jgi:uncharacterized protein (TIGR02147 family)
MLLSGKKKISVGRALEVSGNLKLESEDQQRLIAAVLEDEGVALRGELPNPDLQNFDRISLEVLKDWYYLPILDLSTTKGFKSEATWMANRLGINVNLVKEALEKLQEIGLLEVIDGRYRKTEKRFHLPTKKSAPAVRLHHLNMMGQAKRHLEDSGSENFADRMICSVTVAADSRRIREARQRVLEFQKQLAQFLAEGESDEVYQINLQLFPLTQIKRKKGRK